MSGVGRPWVVAVGEVTGQTYVGRGQVALWKPRNRHHESAASYLLASSSLEGLERRMPLVMPRMRFGAKTMARISDGFAMAVEGQAALRDSSAIPGSYTSSRFT